jgi:hypothetical protein
MKPTFKTSLLLSTLTLGVAQSAFATYTPIIRSFHSVRTAGMGDVRYTTGLYEENFFANPARMTANGENRFQLPKFSFEVGSSALGAFSDLLSAGDSGLSAAAESVGKPLSARFQLVLPAYYANEFTGPEWSLGVGLIYGAQTTTVVSQTGYIDPITLVNAGFAFTLARRLLEDNRLSVGATLHTEFRASSNSVFSVRQFLSGTDLTNAIKGGSGIGLDFDLGTTFRPHWKTFGMEYLLAFSINNLLGGQYTNLGGKLADWSGNPLQSNRSFNLGLSASKKEWGPFDLVTIALESTDIGNNPDGSFFRTLHVGSEAKWKKLAARLGFNQGYIAAGFGLDTGFFSLNLATYGEEMGLNAGTLQDRRYALEFGFHI